MEETLGDVRVHRDTDVHGVGLARLLHGKDGDERFGIEGAYALGIDRFPPSNPIVLLPFSDNLRVQVRREAEEDGVLPRPAIEYEEKYESALSARLIRKGVR